MTENNSKKKPILSHIVQSHKVNVSNVQTISNEKIQERKP